MTVTDRQTASTARGASLAEPSTAPGRANVATAVRSMVGAGLAPGSRPLAWTAVRVDAIDPIDLFAAARTLGVEASLWLQPAAGRSIVGLGRAWAAELGGSDRFITIGANWAGLLAEAHGPAAIDPDLDPADATPRLLGGLGFTGGTPGSDSPWQPFGPASLALPTFALSQGGPAPTLTVALAPGRADEPRPEDVQAAWDDLVRAAQQPLATPQTTTALHVVEERPDRTTWERTVGQFAGAVGRGRIDKVVLARRVVLEADTDLDVRAALRHLTTTAPESTTFAFTRGSTTFLGATPERLVRTSGRTFETVAIAGSAPRGRDAAEDARLAAALLASEKEREEHAVVVDTIRAGLAPIVESLEIADGPSVLPLRHLQHLATPITGTTRDESGLLALGGTLHPTPAVGGAPREIALAMIDEHEGFDRGWYAGPIGWLGADGDGELMVALRCGLVAGRRATLFAGCGIVADSDPEREWEESGLKLRTMIAALGGPAGMPTR